MILVDHANKLVIYPQLQPNVDFKPPFRGMGGGGGGPEGAASTLRFSEQGCLLDSIGLPYKKASPGNPKSKPQKENKSFRDLKKTFKCLVWKKINPFIDRAVTLHFFLRMSQFLLTLDTIHTLRLFYSNKLIFKTKWQLGYGRTPYLNYHFMEIVYGF